jgi:hypothetical protein
MRHVALAVRVGFIALAFSSPLAAQAPSPPAARAPAGIPNQTSVLVHGYEITTSSLYRGTSQKEGQVSAIRQNNLVSVQVTADVCGRGIYLDLTLAGWPENIMYVHTPTKTSFGGQGKVTGTMKRCTNDLLIPCPEHPKYEVQVTGTWSVVPSDYPVKRSLGLHLNLNFQEQLWNKPPDPCKDSGKRQSQWDDVSLSPLAPAPRPAPPGPFQDPLDTWQNQLLQGKFYKAAKLIYDPPTIIQY